jgi:hypothetical protein
MKKTLFVPMLMLVIFSGCSLSEVFEFTVEQSFVVSNEPGGSFTKTRDVYAKDESSDFEKYVDDISKIDIKSASATLTQFTGPSTQKINTATYSIGSVNGSDKAPFATVNNITLQSVLYQEQNLPLNQAGVSKIKELLKKDPYAFRMYLDGSSNEGPLNFTFDVKLVVKATYTVGLF